MEEKITFMSDDLEIEGLFETGEGDSGVVITHPHPLYGGDMHNNVVESIRSVYRSKGYAVLRFNFRGVGNSKGRHDQGRGEQADVLAAVLFLENRGIKKVDLAGYSYGAWINTMAAAAGAPVGSIVLVSPPVGFVKFEPCSLPGLKFAVTGSNDEIAPAVKVKEMFPVWNPKAKFKVIKGADHFYSGYIERLEKVLAAGI